ncbi:hypothetical protein ABIA60_004137 [Pseudomonas frederiksbergensis]
MFSRTLTTTVVFALAFAMFMAWAGHTRTLSTMSKQPSWEIAQDAHHSHDEQADMSCASCSDHYHSPLTPDHQHETPQFTSTLILTAQPPLSPRAEPPKYSVPPPPDDYETLAGLDRLPVIGDKLNWQEWSMTVVEVEERRVTRVLLRKQVQV